MKSLLLLLFFFVVNIFAYTTDEVKTFSNLALHSYDKTLEWFNENKYKVIDVNSELNLFVVKNDNNQTFILFRGTKSLKDVWTDGLQHFGINKIDFKNEKIEKGVANKYLLSSQYVKKYIDDNTIFIGHSLGGGIATYCGLLYNKNTITFNPAPLSKETLSNVDLNNSEKITNFIAYNKTQPDLVAGSSLIKNNLVGDINMVNIKLDDNLTEKDRILKIHSMRSMADNLNTI